jgi:predicted ATPase
MILLDEPDAPLSNTRKQMFYESLLEMKTVFEQMIVVTHSVDMVSYIQANDTDCNIITL